MSKSPTTPAYQGDDFGYTPEILADKAAKMRSVLTPIYGLLFSCDCHPFVEFNGLMAKYVDICNRAAQEGIPFPMATEHAGVVLPVEPHDMEYLGEKLRCIFGPIIDADPRCRHILAEKLFGKGARP